MEPKRYFLSYCYTLVGVPGNVHYGCSVSDQDEHPIETIARWNREHRYRRHVLLWWAEVGEGVPEINNVEI